MWYIWKYIYGTRMYFIDIECVWTTKEDRKSIYTDWYTVKLTADMLEANIGRI